MPRMRQLSARLKATARGSPPRGSFQCMLSAMQGHESSEPGAAWPKGSVYEADLASTLLVTPRTVSAVAACSLATAAFVLILLRNRGADLTDEAYYFAWISHPERFAFDLHSFGVYLHPIYELLGRSVLALRLFGILILMSSGCVLGFFCERYYRAFDGCRDRTLTVLGALFSLAFYTCWLLTPAYNLLANVAAALLFAGALGWSIPIRGEKPNRPFDRGASVLVGFAGCIVFFAKPTFGALAALGIAALLARTARRRSYALALERAALVGFTCVVPLLLHLRAVMPIGTFVRTMRDGTRVLNFGNSLTALPIRALVDLSHGPPLLFVTSVAVVYALADARGRTKAASSRLYRGFGAWALLAVNALFFVGTLTRALHQRDETWQVLGPPMISLVLAQIYVGLGTCTRERIQLATLGPVFLLLILPFLIGFGTVNNLVQQTGASSFAILLASALAARLLFSKRHSLMIQLGLSVGACGLILYSPFAPYHLPKSIWRETEPISLPFSRDRLMVDPLTKSYVDGLQRIASEAALTPDTPVIDLSGGGPGTVLFLGGRAPGYPWLVATYPNATTLVDAVWSTLSKAEQERAWIVGPVDPRFAAARLVRELRDQRSAYRCVGSLSMLFWHERRFATFWKPISQPGSGPESAITLASCTALDLFSHP